MNCVYLGSKPKQAKHVGCPKLFNLIPFINLPENKENIFICGVNHVSDN